jgi:hypothetical protein
MWHPRRIRGAGLGGGRGLEIRPGNEPSLRVAQRAGYHFERRLSRHCRDWSCEDAEHDSWHNCLIWTHESPCTMNAKNYH